MCRAFDVLSSILECDTMTREKTLRMHDNLVGQVLNSRYILEEKIGSGGFATVYSARDKRLNRSVAIKVLNETRSRNLVELDRFRNEASIAAQIDDDHVIRVFDMGEDLGVIYLVMELLKGEPLRNRMRDNRPWPWRDAVEMAYQVCVAVERAHEHNIAHRDIKPENLFVVPRRGQEEIKLVDLGIAKVLGTTQWHWLAQNLTGTDGFVGSPSYMAPEQVQGSEHCDLRVDVYSVGIVLYEMLAGDVPYRGETPWETMLMHSQREPLSLKERLPGVELPMGLQDVLDCALAKSMYDRYRTVGNMAAALQRVLTGKARPLLPPEEPHPLARTELAEAARGKRALAGCAEAPRGASEPAVQVREASPATPVAESAPADSAPMRPLQRSTRYFLGYMVLGSTIAVGTITTLLLFALNPEHMERIALQRRAMVRVAESKAVGMEADLRPAPSPRSAAIVGSVAPDVTPAPLPASDTFSELGLSRGRPKRTTPRRPSRADDLMEVPRRQSMAAMARRAASEIRERCRITPFSPYVESTVDVVFKVAAGGEILRVESFGATLRQPDCAQERARALIGSFAGASDLRGEYRHSYTVLR